MARSGRHFDVGANESAACFLKPVSYWKRTTLLLAVILLLIPAMAPADGGFYSATGIRPDLTDQRAILVFDGVRQFMVLQSKFDGAAGNFGWVVPVPEAKGLFTLSPEEAGTLFLLLDRITRPEAVPIYSWLGGAVLAAALFFGIYLTATGKGITPGCLSVGLVILCYFSIPQFGSYRDRVRVIEERQVGPYDVTVIRGTDGEAVREWLSGNGYDFGPADAAVLDDYAARGWCFVTAKFQPDVEQATDRAGMVTPLALEFVTEKAVYPLALTGLAGEPTRVLLWVLAPFQMQTDQRFELVYADESDRALSLVAENVQGTNNPEFFSTDSWMNCRYLTGFEAQLSPADMKMDSFFSGNETAEPFQRKVIGGATQGIVLSFAGVLLLLLHLVHLAGLRSIERKKRKKEIEE